MPTSYSGRSKTLVVIAAVFVVGLSASPTNARTAAELKAGTQPRSYPRSYLRGAVIGERTRSAELPLPPRQPG